MIQDYEAYRAKVAKDKAYARRRIQDRLRQLERLSANLQSWQKRFEEAERCEAVTPESFAAMRDKEIAKRVRMVKRRLRQAVGARGHCGWSSVVRCGGLSA